MRGVEQGSVAVRCNYESRWKTYRKWWCRGASWDYCKVLIQTAGTEEEVQRNRVSIRDNQTAHLLTVTMKDVRQDDTDTYWCGIQKTGIDLGARIRVTIDPGKNVPLLLKALVPRMGKTEGLSLSPPTRGRRETTEPLGAV